MKLLTIKTTIKALLEVQKVIIGGAMAMILLLLIGVGLRVNAFIFISLIGMFLLIGISLIIGCSIFILRTRMKKIKMFIRKPL